MRVQDFLSNQEDFSIETKPVWTNHAKKRLNEGRAGSFVCKRSKNKMVVVTVLPNGKDRSIPVIQHTRKERDKSYKVK